MREVPYHYSDGTELVVREPRGGGIHEVDLRPPEGAVRRLSWRSRLTSLALQGDFVAAKELLEVMGDGRGHEICGKKLRGGGTCGLKVGHRRKAHTSCTYTCDGCGEPRIEPPHATHPEAGWYCFMCAGPPAREAQREAEWEAMTEYEREAVAVDQHEHDEGHPLARP